MSADEGETTGLHDEVIEETTWLVTLAQARAADVLNFCLHHQGNPACNRLSERVRQLVEELHQLRINSELRQLSIDQFASRFG